MYAVKIALKIFSSLLLLLILAGSLGKSYNSKRQYVFFINMIFATFFLLVADVFSKFSAGAIVHAVLDSFAFLFYYVTISLFAYYLTAYIREKSDFSYFLANLTVPVCAVFALGWCISAFNGIFFLLRKDLHEPMYWLGQLGGIIVFIIYITIIFKNYDVLKLHDVLVFLSFIIFPVAVFFLRYRYTFISIDASMAISELLIYIFINVKKTQELALQQILISKYKVSVMYRQIRPHFIFNVLNSIYVMCAKDAKLAQNAIEKFSDYLRSNIELMESETAIPFGMELNLVKNYIALEKLRFADELNVEYDISADDFLIPPFTLQPLVENAVKHGVMPKRGGGTVKIRTFRDADFYVVEIFDDGVGFSFVGEGNMVKKTSESMHVGIENVNDRLKIFCGGFVEIKSSSEGGTVVSVKIPAKFGNLRGED